MYYDSDRSIGVSETIVFLVQNTTTLSRAANPNDYNKNLLCPSPRPRRFGAAVNQEPPKIFGEVLMREPTRSSPTIAVRPVRHGRSRAAACTARVPGKRART